MDMDQAFSGIKVLAVARIVAAPFAAYQLAMHGADVIHVEHPEDGDSSRTSGNLDTPFHKARMAHNFLAYNANKRSITLAINTAAGQEVFRRMARSADVVIENLKGGTMARYGLGYDDLSKINPRIVFCSVTGYGQTGPKKSDPAIDGVVQAVSGMMSRSDSADVVAVDVAITADLLAVLSYRHPEVRAKRASKGTAPYWVRHAGRRPSRLVQEDEHLRVTGMDVTSRDRRSPGSDPPR